MKVHIGPYLNYYGSYQLSDYLKVFGLSDDKCHDIGKWLSETWVQKVCDWIYDKRKRKISVKIDEFDVWSADHTLALVILPILKKIKEEKHGYPLVSDDDVPNHLKSVNASPKEYEYEWDDLAEDRWYYVLNKMIFAFDGIVDDSWENKFHSGNADYQFVEEENGICRLEHGPNHTAQFDVDGYDNYNKEIQKGLDLFAKYFRSLWT